MLLCCSALLLTMFWFALATSLYCHRHQLPLSLCEAADQRCSDDMPMISTHPNLSGWPVPPDLGQLRQCDAGWQKWWPPRRAPATTVSCKLQLRPASYWLPGHCSWSSCCSPACPCPHSLPILLRSLEVSADWSGLYVGKHHDDAAILTGLDCIS